MPLFLKSSRKKDSRAFPGLWKKAGEPHQGKSRLLIFCAGAHLLPLGIIEEGLKRGDAGV